MYAVRNFKTKKDMKRAVQNGELVLTYQPGPFAGPTNGPAAIEGPHYPQPHRWYAQVELKDGLIVMGSVR